MRKTYIVSKWDKEAGKGYATDGTSWEGDPIEFSVFTITIPDYNGYLDPGETITAVERIGDYPECERWLTDVIVESGPRAFNQFSNTSEKPPVVFDPNPPTTIGDLRYPLDPEPLDVYLKNHPEFRELVRRVSALEAQVYGEEDNS